MLKLSDLEVYKISLEISKISWIEYSKFDWRIKKIIGDQFIRSIDSIGANIAEGYGRFHYLDKIRFFYNARGSLYESVHWIKLLKQRELLSIKQFEILLRKLQEILKKLNGLISSTYKTKNKPNY